MHSSEKVIGGMAWVCVWGVRGVASMSQAEGTAMTKSLRCEGTIHVEDIKETQGSEAEDIVGR